ncbi:OLC1v1014182C2 [Oldenlandia corymbosa var. corymbosa]|uniref:OLC1v1014182C2 n=1 Tax=Oldenlandia corymbosa var. corymbosa TaxID=529605 RepID=A0AAV1E024_OLDCO|nr:OLC1v1014182C2 [Oldenlandia corymbosa var. corymbosa]
MAAAKVAISSSSSSLCIKFAPTQKFSPSLLPHISSSSPKRKKINFSRISARLGGEEGDAKQGGKKKFITRDEEPEQYDHQKSFTHSFMLNFLHCGLTLLFFSLLMFLFQIPFLYS